jgi:hypothetical protein
MKAAFIFKEFEVFGRNVRPLPRFQKLKIGVHHIRVDTRLWRAGGH